MQVLQDIMLLAWVHVRTVQAETAQRAQAHQRRQHARFLQNLTTGAFRVAWPLPVGRNAAACYYQAGQRCGRVLRPRAQQLAPVLRVQPCVCECVALQRQALQAGQHRAAARRLMHYLRKMDSA